MVNGRHRHLHASDSYAMVGLSSLSTCRFAAFIMALLLSGAKAAHAWNDELYSRLLTAAAAGTIRVPSANGPTQPNIDEGATVGGALWWKPEMAARVVGDVEQRGEPTVLPVGHNHDAAYRFQVGWFTPGRGCTTLGLAVVDDHDRIRFWASDATRGEVASALIVSGLDQLAAHGIVAVKDFAPPDWPGEVPCWVRLYESNHLSPDENGRPHPTNLLNLLAVTLAGNRYAALNGVPTTTFRTSVSPRLRRAHAEWKQQVRDHYHGQPSDAVHRAVAIGQTNPLVIQTRGQLLSINGRHARLATTLGPPVAHVRP